MPLRRRWTAQALIVVVLSLTGASIYAPREFWPICNYPMFSHLERRHDRRVLALRVVHADGVERDYPQEAPVLYREFDAVSAGALLYHVLRRGSAAGPEMTRLLSLLLEGLHDGRPRGASASETPRSLRLYRVRHSWREGALRPREEERRLLHQVTRAARE